MKAENTGTQPTSPIGIPADARIKSAKGYRNKNGQGMEIIYMVGSSTCRAIIHQPHRA